MTRILLAALLLWPSLALAEPHCRPGEIPDAKCSPGVVASADEEDVCGIVHGQSYSKRHRQTPAGLKSLIKRRYGQAGNFGDAEIDHIVPLSLGGEDSVYNLFWQPGYGQGYRFTYHEKDQIEVWAWRQVCKLHSMPLAEAQAIFMAPDWRVQYCARIGGPACATGGGK